MGFLDFTSRRYLLILAATVILAAGCKQNPAGNPSNGDKPEDQSQVTAISESLELLKNRSIALLENSVDPTQNKEGKALTEAAEGFRKIAKERPSDPLGLQNLCVALLFKIQNARLQSDSSLASLEKEFNKTAVDLQLLTPISPDPWVLEARFYQDKGETEKAEQLLRTAVSKPEARADTYFQLVELLQANDKSAAPEDIRKLLESAIKVSQSNIGLAIFYLNVLALEKDETAFTEQLKKCLDLFAPFASRTGSQLPKLTDGIQKALETKNWNVVQRLANGIRNVLLAEIAYQNDLHLLRPHSLEFIRLRFLGDTPHSADRAVSSLRFESVELKIDDSPAATALAAEDFDLDGRFELVVGHEAGVHVYGFAEGSAKRIASAATEDSVRGIVLADLDRDFQPRKESLPTSALPTTNPPGAPPISNAGMVDTDIDVVVYGPAGIRLLENVLGPDKKVRSLVERKLSEEMAKLQGVRAVTAIDFDHDSDLDLVVSSDKGITLWSNRGDWTFANSTDFSGLPDSTKRYDSILAFDADRNVLIDLIVGSDQLGLPVMLGNNLHGRYHVRDLAWPKELQGCCRSLDAIDVNRDACWDMITCGEKGVRVVLMKSPGRHGWIPDSVAKLSEQASLGLIANDFNNDGYTDCLSWGKQGCELFAGQSSGQLVKQDKGLQLSGSLKQMIAIDIDGDGDDDILGLSEQGELLLQKNIEGSKNQQLTIVLRADEDGSQRPRERCNMHGVGSLVELKSEGVYQSQIVRGTRTRFGLGEAKGADIMRVVWTNGTPNNILDVKSSSTVFDQQRVNGSCPYIYCWNGERFEFFSDCLWAAPIGLQFGPGILAPTREWEYLKIDGSALKPNDGKYVLQLTEELWEAAYFDSVQLMAVDHPADVQVYSNEKVGPAELAEFKIYTVKQRFQPAVKDQTGKDLTELVSARDRRYTKTWNQGLNQGLTELHWLEIDLNNRGEQNGSQADGAVQSDEKVLFLTGWIFPTCTSLNLAMAENPLRPDLMPPSIQVPDEAGNWVEVIPFTGFPGGKTKTIAIDLKGKFLCNDHRVRLVSNMELCWDELFYSVNERESAAGSYRTHSMQLLSADLHYRGFSDQQLQPGNAPNYYDYSRVTKESSWAPMKGNFTRYGNVADLLREADDLQVVMGAGDEVTIEFAEPQEKVPEGWVREFIIYNVGWDKDADLNTIQGQNVEPLPFRAMKSYPYEPEQQFPNTPAHLDYLRQYQTRHQDAGIFWNQIRDSL